MIALFLFACGAGDDSAATATAPCEEELRATDTMPGLQLSGTHSTLQLDLATPADVAVGENHWQLRLTDGADNQLSGCTLSGSLYMPDHGHGGSVPDISTQTSGTYSMEFWLSMGGLWELSFTTTCEDESLSDTFMVSICAE